MIEQAKFTDFCLEKALEKKKKMIEDRGIKIQATENHEKQHLNWMNLLKKILILRKIAYHLKNKKIYLINLLMKVLMNMKILKK